MFAIRRTHLVRATLSIAALSAGLLAANAHAGLLGGSGGFTGGLTGALQPRSPNVGGNAAGNASGSAAVDGALIKDGADKTKTQAAGTVKPAAGDAAGNVRNAAQSLNDQTGSTVAGASGAASTTPTASPAAPAAVTAAGSKSAEDRNVQTSGGIAAGAARADRSVAVGASGSAAAQR